MIDQRQLPGELVLFQATNVAETVKAIKDMAVRGAPAIGAAGAFGLALAAFASTATTASDLLAHLEDVKRTLDASRPTAGAQGVLWYCSIQSWALPPPLSAAVNLMWATERVVAVARELAVLPGMTAAALAGHVLSESQALAEEDVDINTRLARAGAAVVPSGAHMLHHCNTGALATIDVGTALGVIYGEGGGLMGLALGTCRAHGLLVAPPTPPPLPRVPQAGQGRARVGRRDAPAAAGGAPHRLGAHPGGGTHAPHRRLGGGRA